MVVGLCDRKCPDEEINDRIKQKRIHPLERDVRTQEVCRHRCVKEYVRSAAGSTKCHHATLLRTPVALATTVNYLLGPLLHASSSLLHVTNFITDRLRAIRQDLIVQQLDVIHGIPILERIVKYHILIGWSNRKFERSCFDSTLNQTFIASYLSDLFEYYDIAETRNENERVLSNYPEFMSYFVLIHCDDSAIINKAYQKHLRLKTKFTSLMDMSLLNRAFKVARLCHLQNFNRILKHLVPTLSSLQKCSLLQAYGRLHVQYLKTIIQAYSSKIMKLPLSTLCRWFATSFDNDMVLLLKQCGIVVDHENLIQFTKSNNVELTKLQFEEISRGSEYGNVMIDVDTNMWTLLE